MSNRILRAWDENSKVFICGNGGSAANAMHIANDLFYGVGAYGSSHKIKGINVEALSTNAAIITCLANDVGYEHIFSNQIDVKGDADDVLIVLSGSGNSPNVLQAIQKAKSKRIETFAIVSFDGGKCKEQADHVIHVKINDMQIAEDSQLIIGHICMQWLRLQYHKGSE